MAVEDDNDITMAGGREVFGFPKKMANFHKNGAKVQGWVERKDCRFIELSADLRTPLDDAEALQRFMLSTGTTDGEVHRLSYNVKHFITPDSSGFEFSPRLVRRESMIRPTALQVGKAAVNLTFSADDPWAAVELVKILGAIYTVGETMPCRKARLSPKSIQMTSVRTPSSSGTRISCPVDAKTSALRPTHAGAGEPLGVWKFAPAR